VRKKLPKLAFNGHLSTNSFKVTFLTLSCENKPILRLLGSYRPVIRFRIPPPLANDMSLLHESFQRMNQNVYVCLLVHVYIYSSAHFFVVLSIVVLKYVCFGSAAADQNAMVAGVVCS
jgi:hypothetical protein